VLGPLQAALNIDAAAVVEIIVNGAQRASALSRWRVALPVVIAGMILSPLGWVPPPPKTVDGLHRILNSSAPPPIPSMLSGKHRSGN
jgi:hypothetical protein